MKNEFIKQVKTVANGFNDAMEPVFKEVYFVQFLCSSGAVYNHFKTFDSASDLNDLFINIHTAIATGKMVHLNNPELWMEVEPVYGSARHQELGDKVFA